MIVDELPTVSLHNVTEVEPADWTDGGHALRRVPGSVRANLNVDARERYRRPAGSELRFVPGTDESVTVTLSASERALVRPFWGPFQSRDLREVGPDPRAFEFALPERVRGLGPGVATGPFDARVCRLRFERDAEVAVHGVSGRCRPPESDEVPDRRLLAYGTSITEGAAATAGHLTYVAQAADRLEADALNLGASGSAFCEPAIADHIASRDDWDVAVLAVSVNMSARGFTVEQFRERASNLVEAVAGSDPDREVFAVTLYTHNHDLVTDGDRERADAFREALRTAAADASRDNLHLVEGRELLSPPGLTVDVVHPGDRGMAEIGEGLAAAVERTVD